MKISIAQISSQKGNIDYNIQKHLKFVDAAINQSSDLILFPELSITNYEPELANELATTTDDSIFKPFQLLSDQNKISIGIGMPIRKKTGIQIGLIIFQPQKGLKLYAKQLLHKDELPYFIPGTKDILLNIRGEKIGFGICYESLQKEQLKKANTSGVKLYLASVAKPKNGIMIADNFFPEMAKELKMPILMSNSIGPSDNFISYGCSAVWNSIGKKVIAFDVKTEGIITYDTESNQAEQWNLS